jgi:transketolase
MRPSIRLAALQGARVIYVFTHDSIGLGEDGPTHQPVEHLASLRAMPGINVIRPADANETVEAWKAALLNRKGPTALVFSRQDLPVIDRGRYAPAAMLHKGAYVLADPPEGKPEIILIATGSEVHLALEAYDTLNKEGKKTRVVNMPCLELYELQPDEYKKSVLPPEVTARVSIEAASTFGWSRYVGDAGLSIGVDRFGSSAPGNVNMKEYGLTAVNLADAARGLTAKKV